MGIALVWLRDDLRLDDQPALRAALERDLLPLPVYIHAPEEEGEWAPGAASMAWRRRSLRALATELERRGSRLLPLTQDMPKTIVPMANGTILDQQLAANQTVAAIIRQLER